MALEPETEEKIMDNKQSPDLNHLPESENNNSRPEGLPELPTGSRENPEDSHSFENPSIDTQNQDPDAADSKHKSGFSFSLPSSSQGKLEETREKIHGLLTNPKFSLTTLVLAVIFAIASMSSAGSSSSARSELAAVKRENESLSATIAQQEKELDELKNGPHRLLEKIKAAYEDEDWNNVVTNADQLHQKFAGSSQDQEVQEKYLPKAQDEVKKAEEAKKAAEEEQKQKEEEERKKKEEEEAKARAEAEEKAAQEKAEAEEAAKRSASQKNAIRKAESYLRFTAFSRDGLIEQLEFEGFSNEDAVYAVDHITVDWNEQAYEKAKDYLEFTSFSRDGLIEQLEFEGFTPDQAAYGADKAYSE